MSQVTAGRRVVKALAEGESAITPMGECSAQEKGGSVYGLLPPGPARAHGIAQGTRMTVGYLASANAYVLIPANTFDSW